MERDNLTKKIVSKNFELNSNSTFMESLILAQDERWRRA